MSGVNSDLLHRSTLSVYNNLMDQFNPGLQKLVTLGNSYIKAFQALALTSEAYFSALAKMGEQALSTLSSRSLGDVLIQISETQRKLTAEAEGVFRWFHVEVLQAMDKNVKLDEEYIEGSRRVYELEVRNQAASLERQLRRGAFRDSLESSEYMQYLRQSQHEILKEEERRYRFLAEKHCGLTQSLLYLINKTGVSLQQRADGWKEKVSESRSSRPRTPTPLDQEAQLKSSVGSLLQTGDREMDREPLGRVPSRAPSPLPSRSRSSSVGESLGLGGGRSMRAIVSHPASSNPVLLPFARGDLLTVLIPEPRNGWLYGRHDPSLRQGWFPAAYVASTEDFLPVGLSISHRSHSMNNLLEPTSQSESDTQTYSEVSSPVVSMRRASADVRSVSPLPEKKTESNNELKSGQKVFHEIPAPATQLRRGSADVRSISPLPDRRAESHFESKVELKNYNELPPPAPPLPNSPLPERKTDLTSERPSTQGQPPEHPLFPRGSNPFATVKLRPTVTNDRSAPRIQ
ncbi:BAR/IMD domain-containing adapter protein 2-like 2 [Danio rerio]|uniref:BAR/IMD domain-containing adapter protein 2-like 2 n=1 Tax=Danio rerio TaxID=7955 RepID=BI2L2_DANRE|nr:brain-specific angiogenesis inhibitor 1-associated protein 2-like protein 2 [Danio rerio]Q1LWE6.1 RecName: Full=Brain-specific angiogenesis inhibitor 1-associated protein 2-like protein 2; Short=BAI1-associated protein 2-like protein 2 [Danio rerio]CAK10744.1 novel protein similar to vertebrate BAI1-associated protein 2-like 2 (BAIAP2L2) [Danio rerio]|eukprot:NP_001074273.1 brain-specific angiogenesis inhibitor 1-associated protein 2-like protein 2 [Danio rerio]